MREKIVWVMLSFLMVLSLVIASCAPTTPTTSTTPTSPTKPTNPALPTTPSTQGPEVPKYGGMLVGYLPGDPTVFDAGARPGSPALTQTVYQGFMFHDWRRSAAGTGEYNAAIGTASALEDLCAPLLAESWETPEIGTWVLHIRQGVHWALNPASEASRLMNGRQVTADDFVSSFNRKNLCINIIEKKQAFPKLVKLLEKYKNESVIIYCFSRRDNIINDNYFFVFNKFCIWPIQDQLSVIGVCRKRRNLRRDHVTLNAFTTNDKSFFVHF